VRKILATLVLFAFAAGSVGETRGGIIVLKLAWAKKYRNLLSIDAKVTVLKLNTDKEADGDSHGGSRVNTVGLPMVAEILNGLATGQKDAREALKPGPGAQAEKDVYGAWRLWFEHPPHDGGAQCQSFSATVTNVPSVCATQSLGGAPSNPDHSFEIHPVFAVNGKPIGRSSLVLTSDNTSVKETEQAISHYTGPNKILHVVRSSSALTLSSLTVSHNYARMRIRIVKVRVETKRDKDGTVDGGFVVADVLVSGDESHVRMPAVRMFYLLDSEPGDKLKTAAVGDEFVVIAMPRLNLDEILTKTETQPSISPPIPLEFIIVAIVS
jgi:hypothetical protein